MLVISPYPCLKISRDHHNARHPDAGAAGEVRCVSIVSK
jgi:hypothetical protein